MTVVRAANQLRGYVNRIRRPCLFPADASLQDVSCFELLPDLAHTLPGILVLHRRGTGRDLEARHRREAAGDLLGDAVGKVSIGRGTKVLEWKHDQRLSLRHSGPR